MSTRALFLSKLKVFGALPSRSESIGAEERAAQSDTALPASITRAASKQTYYTIRFLVDRGRETNAYRTYAYFRWVDDRLDQRTTASSERLAFIQRQQMLLNRCYQGLSLLNLCPEEQMLVELIRGDRDPESGLYHYTHNMMSVMRFDAERRGQQISARELDEYTRWLATAVTEAMHYFIGHDDASPQGKVRYCAVTAAHITHMLRDTCEDVAAGYYNIPREYLQAYGISPWDIESDAYCEWAKSRVKLARSYFEIGRNYLAQVQNRRCRLAGYAYMARFEGVLDAIEAEGYQLRSDYSECKHLNIARGVLWAALSLAFRRVPSSI